MRNTNAGFFPGMRLSAAIELYYISLAVFIGDLEGKPLTISKLSRAVGFLRSTLSRKVVVAIDLGYVESAFGVCTTRVQASTFLAIAFKKGRRPN
jgi:hypothetical protein